MKKITLGLIAVLAFLGGSTYAQVAKVIINNQSTTSKKVVLIKKGNMNQYLTNVEMRGHATHEIDVNLGTPQFHVLTIGEKRCEILIFPEETVKVEVGEQAKITFEGSNRNVNNYINNSQSMLTAKKTFSPMKVTREMVEYEKKLYENEIGSLNEDKVLTDEDKKNIIGYFQSSMLSKAVSLARAGKIFGKAITVEVEENFAKPLYDIDFISTICYDPLWYTHLIELMYHKINAGEIKIKNLDSWIVDMAKSIKDKQLKDDFMIEAVASEVFSGYLVGLNKRVELVRKELTNHELSKKLDFQLSIANGKKKQYINGIPGTYIGDLTFLDTKGETVALNRYKGKIVFIDMWSTSCSPCIGEIPFMKALEHKFEGEPIAWVSISSDSDKGTWLRFLEKREMKGEQLIIAKENRSQLAKIVGSHGIPHFIILDRNGKIVDCNTYRPSNPILEVSLRQSIKQK